MSRYDGLDALAERVVENAARNGKLDALAVVTAGLLIGRELAAVSASIDSLADAVNGMSDVLARRTDDHSNE